MKKSWYCAIGLSVLMIVTSVWADFPFGASDPVYGLRSRIVEDASFQYHPSPEDWRDINMYQIFTDRFASSGDTLQYIQDQGWYVGNRHYPENRNFHHGGDWKGLRQNLDYLEGMGVNAVWISGVQMNWQGQDTRFTPYHYYHPTDFFKVDPAQGTFQDLKDLIDEMHDRGMYVILDVVPNHMADLSGLWGNNREDNNWFHPHGNDSHGWWTDRRHGAPFDDLQYFHNHGRIRNWDSWPEYELGAFPGTDDLRTSHPQVREWLTLAFKNLIDATDVDGFRVDAIKHMEEDFIMHWADEMRRHAAYRGKNDFIIFGEYFTYDNETLARFARQEGYSFNSALFFPMSQTFMGVFAHGNGTRQLTHTLNLQHAYGEGQNRLITFIDNHDVNRIGTEAGGNVGHIEWIMPPALTFLYTATPVPCLFYGTEHAFQQGGHRNGQNAGQNYDDHDHQRETMFDKGFQPGPAQGNKLAQTDAPLYQHIAALNRARADHISLRRGGFDERWATDHGRGPYAFLRQYGDEHSLVAFNTADHAQSIYPQVDKEDGTVFFNALNPDETVTVSGGTITFELPGQGTKIFVAGTAPAALWARNTSNWPEDGEIDGGETVWINTEAGPSEDVLSVTLGYTADGGETWQTSTMSVNSDWSSDAGDWYNVEIGPFASGTVVSYYIAVGGEDDAQAWDNNNGQDYTFAVGEGGAALWVQNTSHWPAQGDANTETEIFINTEAGPAGSVESVVVTYSTDDGETWTPVDMVLNDSWDSDGGYWFNANLGTFPADTTIRYFIAVGGPDDAQVWDNNHGEDYFLTIEEGVEPATLWIRNVNNWPVDGDVTPATELFINAEAGPADELEAVIAWYSTDDGDTWTDVNMSVNEDWGSDGGQWYNANLGTFAAGTTVLYWLEATDGEETVIRNNSGLYFQVTVRGTALAITSPASSLTVTYGTEAITVEGISSGIYGQLLWDNNATGGAGMIAATETWMIENIPLEIGANIITVRGQVGGGIVLPGPVAEDEAANYGEGEWFNGANEGTGFDPWIMNEPESGAGQFIDHERGGFGLWSQQGDNLAEAMRPFAAPLQVDDTFSLHFNNGSVRTGGSIGVAMRNASGETVWEFYFNGGDENYSITNDETEIGWTGAGINISFTVTGTDSYSVVIHPDGSEESVFTGTFAADGPITEMRAWSYSNGAEDPEDNWQHDFFFDHFVLTGTGASWASSSITITRQALDQTDSNEDGVPDVWYETHSLDPTTPNLGSQMAPNGYTYQESYRMDLNPNDDSMPAFLMHRQDEGFAFSAPGGNGRRYRIQHTPDLNSPFVDIGDERDVDINNEIELNGDAIGFYRVRFIESSEPIGPAINSLETLPPFISEENDVWIDSGALPEGSSVSAQIVYCVDGGCEGPWPVADMERNMEWENGDWWHIELGNYPDGTIISFAVVMVDNYGVEHWDNNNGNNYTVVIGD